MGTGCIVATKGRLALWFHSAIIGWNGFGGRSMPYQYTRRYTGPLKAVVLGWAGTTVDFGCMAPTAALMETFKRSGFEISQEQARAPMGLTKWDHIRTVLNMPSIAGAWADKYGSAPTERDVDALFERYIPLQISAVARYADVIPGAAEAVGAMRARGLRIGSTTGYPRAVMDVLAPAAAAQAYAPDVVVCAGETPSGRPGPSMALKAMIELDVGPVEACVKIGDTIPDVEEGLNAGMWTIAVADTGSEVGLPLSVWDGLSSVRRAELRSTAEDRLRRAGAHYVVGSAVAALLALESIESRLARGEKP